MNSKRLWATTAATLFALSAVGPRASGVWAQLSEQATCPTGWEWNQNSLGQDPCAISSQLDAACRGVGSYTIPPLNSTQNYVPPQKDSTADLTCDCDTVMYSLYMACSTCQGGIIYSWAKYIAQCETVYVTQYPHDVPYGTAVPHWAFYDVTTLPNQTYSDSVAMSVGRNPEATAKVLSTATFGTSTTRSGSKSSSTSGSGSNPTNTSTNGGSGSKTPLAAIVGGAVGGVVLISVAVIAGILISRRKKNSGSQPPLQPLPETAEYQKVQPMSPMLSPGGNLPYNGPPPQGMPYNGQPPQGMPYNAPPQDMPYNPATGPTLPYNAPTSPGLPFNASPPPNVSYNAPPTQNPPTGYYNPEDPTTFPPPMGDGQSSVTYTNTSTGAAGPNRYGGMPEL